MNSTVNSSATELLAPTSGWTTLALDGLPIVQAFEANTFFTRLRGLHAILPLAMNQALIIRPCNSIHTMTMSTAIDVIFIDQGGQVLRCETVKRYRFVRCAKARAVVEMKQGAIVNFGISCASQLTHTRECGHHD